MLVQAQKMIVDGAPGIAASGIASAVAQEVVTAKASRKVELDKPAKPLSPPESQATAVGVVDSLSSHGIALSVAAKSADNVQNQRSVAAVISPEKIAKPSVIERAGALQQTEDARDVGLVSSNLKRRDQAQDSTEEGAIQSELQRKQGELLRVQSDESLSPQQRQNEITKIRAEVSALEQSLRSESKPEFTLTRNHTADSVTNSARAQALQRKTHAPEFLNQSDAVIAKQKFQQNHLKFEQVQQFNDRQPLEKTIDMLV